MAGLSLKASSPAEYDNLGLGKADYESGNENSTDTTPLYEKYNPHVVPFKPHGYFIPKGSTEDSDAPHAAGEHNPSNSTQDNDQYKSAVLENGNTKQRVSALKLDSSHYAPYAPKNITDSPLTSASGCSTVTNRSTTTSMRDANLPSSSSTSPTAIHGDILASQPAVSLASAQTDGALVAARSFGLRPAAKAYEPSQGFSGDHSLPDEGDRIFDAEFLEDKAAQGNAANGTYFALGNATAGGYWNGAPGAEDGMTAHHQGSLYRSSGGFPSGRPPQYGAYGPRGQLPSVAAPRDREYRDWDRDGGRDSPLRAEVGLGRTLTKLFHLILYLLGEAG